MRTLSSFVSAASLVTVTLAVAVCGGGLNQTMITCPAGRTLLDGVCVSDNVADYVACVRAQGAQLGGEKSQQISAEAGYLGVKAGGAAELSESLSRKYAVSDQATLEIIRTCNSAAGLGATVATTPPPTATAAETTAPTTVTTTVTTPPQAKDITAQFEGRKYTLLANPSSWHEAKDLCAERGMHLVTVASKAENDFLYNTFAKDKVIWLGLTDERTEGTFGWITGEPVGFTNWASGEPNGGAVEHYGIMGNWQSKTSSAYFRFGVQWNDMSASGRFHKEQFSQPVCESN